MSTPDGHVNSEPLTEEGNAAPNPAVTPTRVDMTREGARGNSVSSPVNLQQIKNDNLRLQQEVEALQAMTQDLTRELQDLKRRKRSPPHSFIRPTRLDFNFATSGEEHERPQGHRRENDCATKRR